MKLIKITASVAMILGLTSQGSAEETEATIDAYAAGYKAAFTCSGLFNAGKSLPDITIEELSGIYELVQKKVKALPNAQINVRERKVSVKYSDDMPPRVVQWRPHLGCVQLPVGAEEEMLASIPKLPDSFKAPNAKVDGGKPWKKIAETDAPTENLAFNNVIDGAFRRGTYGSHARTTAILIATKDEIIAEHYLTGFSPTTSQRTWSVAKSIAASVIGAAAQQGIVDVKAQANIPEWSRTGDPRGKITIENLLHMASGLDSNKAGNRTDRLYIGGGLVTDTATRTAVEVKAGARWKYANNDTLLAVRSLRAAFNDDAKYLSFPFTELLYKIGMNHTKLETDWDGNFILSSQVWTTSRDMARLGILHLNDGVWNGERILPKGWANYVATPAPSQPPARADGSPTRGYGAQWWLYQDFPGIPSDTYAALGNRGQFLLVIPSKGLLIVRRGHDMAGGQGFEMHRFAADLLAAMDGSEMPK